MSRDYMKSRYVTAERAIEDKLQVLRDFYIVDNKNEEEYRKVLLLAVLRSKDGSNEREAD